VTPGLATDGCVVTGRLSRLTADVNTNQMLEEEVLIEDEYLYASAGDGAKRKMRKSGKVKLRVEVTFTPTSGEPVSDDGTVKLVKTKRGYSCNVRCSL